MLSTSDAHGLYEKFGFKAIDKPENFMAVVNRDIYNIDPNSSAT